MKTLRPIEYWLAVLAIGGGTICAHAVDGLKIQVHQETNVLLRWPSMPGQTYVIAHATNLTEPVSWTVLDPAYPAADNTNESTFMHYDQIPVPVGSGGQNLSVLGSGTGPRKKTKILNLPMVVRNGVNSTPVPLCLYPYGVDLTGCSIIWPDGSEEVWTKELANDFFISNLAQADKATGGQLPLTGESSEISAVSCGFYRVLGVIAVSGVTNGATLTDYFSLVAKPEYGAKSLRLLVDGKIFPGQDALLPPFTNQIIFEDVDSARASNGGPYNVQVEALYQIPSPHSEGLYHVLSQPIQVYFSNELSFPNWDDLTEDEVCNFDVVSAHPEVDWEIDVYNIFDYIDWLDGNLPNIIPVHVMTGSTTNGIIQYDWNYLDDFGIVRTNIYDDPYFVSFTYTTWLTGGQALSGPSAAGGGGGAAKANPLKRQPAKWPRQGHWVVSWQDMFRHYYDEDDYLKLAFYNLLVMANLPETDVPAAPPFWQPPIGGTNAQTFPLRHFFNKFRTDLNPTNSDYYQSTINDESLFQNMLLDSRTRNLFYYGHGTADWLASGVYGKLLKQYGVHRYRFVWLDGCETGAGDWDKVFGINGPGVFNIEYYRERTKRPALFVGNKFSVPIGVPGIRTEGEMVFNGTIPRSQSEFYNQFIYYWWLLGRPFNEAVTDAQDLVKAAYPQPVMRYVDGPKSGQVYWPGDDQIRAGYDGMQFNIYNKNYDIPRP